MPLFDENAFTATFDLYSRLLEIAVKDDIAELIISDIAQLIRHRDETGDWDEEGVYVEDLIGTSFIILQTKIRCVTYQAVVLNEALSKFGVDIRRFSTQSDVRALGENYKDTGSTLVQLIWDVGNYFKHRDEWPPQVWVWDGDKIKRGPGWQQLNTNGRNTCESVARVGIGRSSNANLRIAYEFMDVVPHSSCVCLAQRVQEWADQVYAHCEAELPVDPEMLRRARARRYVSYRRSRVSD